MAEWKVGDLVFLKSGSPQMTVAAIGRTVTCVWFNGMQQCEGSFDAAMLESSKDVEARANESRRREDELIRRAGRELNGGF